MARIHSSIASIAAKCRAAPEMAEPPLATPDEARALNAYVADRPVLMLDPDTREPGPCGVGLYSLRPDMMRSLCRYLGAGGLPRSILRVAVVQTGVPIDGDVPDISGRYQVLEDGVRFVPHFPFELGLSYQISFDPRPLGHPELSKVLALVFSLPRGPDPAPTEVSHIFPSSNELPENLLRFYLCFSNPMRRGHAEAEIALLGHDGEPAPDVLYRAPVELWDSGMRSLTILLDPGRLKRGVGPNRELGPPLKTGLVYLLAVGAGMTDMFGRQLGETVYKRFRITDAVRQPVAVEQWTLVAPATDSRQPLVLLFPRPLDWAMLSHTFAVASECGKRFGGRIVIEQCERRLSFTPTSSWAAGSYSVRVASSLEDVCGNSVLSAFDRPVQQGNDSAYEARTRSIPFHLA